MKLQFLPALDDAAALKAVRAAIRAPLAQLETKNAARVKTLPAKYDQVSLRRRRSSRIANVSTTRCWYRPNTTKSPSLGWLGFERLIATVRQVRVPIAHAGFRTQSLLLITTLLDLKTAAQSLPSTGKRSESM